jgi:hypothetical protein
MNEARRRLRSGIAVCALALLAIGANGSSCFSPAAAPAPAAPTTVPVVGLSANGATQTALYRGWPLFLDVALLHPEAFTSAADANALVIVAQGASWAGALTLDVKDAAGSAASWPIVISPPAPGDLRLDARTEGDLLAWLAPASTTALAPGDYVVVARLDTRGATAVGAFRGLVESVPVAVHVSDEPVPLPALLEIRKLELLAQYQARAGDLVAARGFADELALRHPESPRGFALLGDLDAQDGHTAQASDRFSDAIAAFLAANPDAEEPPTELLARRRELRSQLLRVSLGTGSPRISARVTGHAPDAAPDVLVVDVLLSNAGNAPMTDGALQQVNVRVLDGAGVVALDVGRSPALPLRLPGLAAGGATTVRLYVSVPATVKRFAIEERGLAQGELGGDFRFALSQAVTR